MEPIDKHKGKILSLNICCFGVNHIGVPVAAVFAYTCPYVNVAVVDLVPEKVTSWNTRQINMREKGLEEILRKCQNRNLVFTADVKKVVNLADLIFLCLDTSPNSVEGQISDLTDTEKAVRFIAQESKNNKTVVLKSTVPIGTSESIKNILHANRQIHVEFQVLSVPVFLSTGNAVSSLMKPERVLIGREPTPEGLEAAEVLVSLYSQWVPYERILTMSNSSAEIAKLAQNAFLAQKITNISTLSLICEKVGGDVSEVVKILEEFSTIGQTYLEPSFGFGGPHLKNDLKSLLHMCEHLHLKESAEYWKTVLKMNDYHIEKFTKKITSTYFNTLGHEKISVWGIAFKKNAEFVEGSLGIDLCLKLLTDGAKVNVYDTIEKRLVMDEFNSVAAKSGFDSQVLLKELTYYDDPYKAANKTDAIVVCNEMQEFKNVDFNSIYKNMTKPPHIFDGKKCLPHEKLREIGFIIKTIGVKSK